MSRAQSQGEVPPFAPFRHSCHSACVIDAPDRPAMWLDPLTDHVLAHGIAGSSLRALARAAGTSDRMLLYYYPDKNALLAAVLDHAAARMAELLDAVAPPEPLVAEELRARVAPMLREPVSAPFMRLWLELAARGAAGDALARRVGAAIGGGFIVWIETHLVPGAGPAAAARLLAEIEGMVLLDSLGMANVVDQALG